MDKQIKQPLYRIGQAVEFTIDTKHSSGKVFKNDLIGWISSIDLYGTGGSPVYKYGITLRFPDFGTHGENAITTLKETEIKLVNKDQIVFYQ